MRVPVGLAHLLGDEGLGILGLDTSAATVAGLASPFGVLKETPVAVQQVRLVRGGSVRGSGPSGQLAPYLGRHPAAFGAAGDRGLGRLHRRAHLRLAGEAAAASAAATSSAISSSVSCSGR